MLEYELIKFYDNWADEMDIYSFCLRPKGFFKKFEEVVNKYFEFEDSLELYVGSNEEIVYESASEVLNSFYVENISKEEATTIKKLFNIEIGSYSYGINILESLLDPILDYSEGLESYLLNVVASTETDGTLSYLEIVGKLHLILKETDISLENVHEFSLDIDDSHELILKEDLSLGSIKAFVEKMDDSNNSLLGASEVEYVSLLLLLKLKYYK